jgi:chromosome segregation ATPase
LGPQAKTHVINSQDLLKLITTNAQMQQELGAVKEAASKAADSSAATATSVTQLEVVVKQLDGRLNGISSDVKQLDSRADSISNDVKQLDSKLNSISSDVQQLDSKLDSRLNSISSDVKQLDSKLDRRANSISSDVQALRSSIDKLIALITSQANDRSARLMLLRTEFKWRSRLLGVLLLFALVMCAPMFASVVGNFLPGAA